MSTQWESRQVICTSCPRGCPLQVAILADAVRVSGQACRRGVRYAREEVTNPRRIVTTTVRVRHGSLPVVPVRSEVPIPKDRIPAALVELRGVVLSAPVEEHQVVLPSVAGTGIAVVASRSLPRVAIGEG